MTTPDKTPLLRKLVRPLSFFRILGRFLEALIKLINTLKWVLIVGGSILLGQNILDQSISASDFEDWGFSWISHLCDASIEETIRESRFQPVLDAHLAFCTEDPEDEFQAQSNASEGDDRTVDEQLFPLVKLSGVEKLNIRECSSNSCNVIYTLKSQHQHEVCIIEFDLHLMDMDGDVISAINEIDRLAEAGILKSGQGGWARVKAPIGQDELSENINNQESWVWYGFNGNTKNKTLELVKPLENPVHARCEQ